MPLPFSHLDILTMDGQKFEVSMDSNQPNFCNLYEPGKPHTSAYHGGQLTLKPSLGLILYTKPYRAGLHVLDRAPFYEFEVDYFLSRIDYPQKQQ